MVLLDATESSALDPGSWTLLGGGVEFRRIKGIREITKERVP